ncbi:MAG: class I SAM-dependent methyltransferase [Promethearchaeota archaeon]
MLVWIIIGILLFLATVLIFGLSRKRCEREYELEGINDPEVAAAFEKMNKLFPFKIIRSRVVSRIKKCNPQGTLVDVGCGSGRLLFQIAKKIENIELVGIEVAREMIEIAKFNLKELSLDKEINLKKGSAEKLPLSDNSVNFIVSTFSLHHWTRPTKAYSEFFRVLKSGGTLLLFDFRRDSRKLCHWFLKFITKVIVPKALKKVGEPWGSLQASYDLDELNKISTSSPFKDITFYNTLCWIFIISKK